MNKKLLLTLLILIFISLSTVSAEDTNITNVNSSSLNDGIDSSLIEDTLIENISDNTSHSHMQVSNISDSPIKASTINAPGGTFTQLQSIIDSASSGDTIEITGDYTYNSGFTTNGISISKSLTILGNGHTMNGVNTARIFYISDGTVTVNNLNFINGYEYSSTSEGGGAIRVYGSNVYLTINYCDFRDNYAYGRGGAIFVSRIHDFNLFNSNFYNNSVMFSSGAVQVHGGTDATWTGYNAIVYNTSFIENHAIGSSGSCYGGIYIATLDKVEVTYCTFIDNSKGYDGGGLCLCGRTPSVTVNNNVFADSNISDKCSVWGSLTYQGNFNNNWWGTNSPNWANLIYGNVPETWIIMNFTNLQEFNNLGGTVELLTSLDTIYNSSSGEYSKFNSYLPLRPVIYNATNGSFSQSGGNVSLNHTTNFTYPSGLSNLFINATIDHQVLNISTSDLSVNINVSNPNPSLVGIFNYIVEVENHGLYDANDVSVNIKLPSILNYLGDNGAGNYNNITGIWNIGKMANGTIKTLNITVRVPFNYSLVNTTHMAYVNVTGTYIDFNILNNNDTVNITIVNITGGSYTLLQYLIDITPENGTLNLTFNVTYDPLYDASLIGGMYLNKTIKLEGDGFTINGNATARIFDISANNVILSNLIFTNGVAATYVYGGYNGGAIVSGADNVTIVNSTFINNTSPSWGACIHQALISSARINWFNILDCKFFDNVPGGGGTLNINGISFISGCLFENNTGGSSNNFIAADKVIITNNAFVNNKGNFGIGSYSMNFIEYNWYGTNNPNLNIFSSYSPKTWVIMNFTNIAPITYSAGTSNLLVSLDTVYNSTSMAYEPLVGGLPTRTVYFNWAHGNVTPNTTNITNNVNANFDYLAYPSMYNWIVNATIDNQMLWIGGADIGITITPSSNPIDDGENITFNVTVVNNGPMNSTNINATIYLPLSGLTILNITPSMGVYNNTTGVWEIGNLTVGQNATLEINGTLADPGPFLIWNATVNYGSEYDYNHTNNTFVCNVTVNQIADLEIHKNLTQNTTPQTKDNITYMIVVYNNGPSTAVNIIVFDNLSSKLLYINSSATKGFYNETTGVWEIDNITPYSNETLNITVTVNKSGFVNNYVNVTSNITDKNLTNNEDNISFTTPPLSDLWVTITMEPQTSNYITYHIQAGNNGIEDANGTVVVFNLSNLYVWFNHTTDKGIYNNDTGVWDIGYLDVNETVNMTLIVRLDFPMGTTFANITTSVNITSWSTDLYPENNTDNITFEAEIFGNFRLLQDIVDSWPENTTQILPRSFAYDPIQDAKLPGETYDLINGVRLYKNVTIVNPNGFTLGGFDMARIFNISANNVILDGLRFFDGNSPLGAALNIHADNVQVLRSNFSGNWLFGDYGGAIYTGGRNTLIMDNIFTENSASKLGGAIGAVGAKNLQILNNTFINNSVESDEIFGGAIGLINSTAIINGNVFLDNIATSSSGLGSAIYTNNSIVNLEANWYGNNTPDMITDELIWGNKPETYIILDWEISNPNMTGVTLNAVFFLYNLTTGNKTPINYGIPYRSLTVTASNPTISWYNITYTGNNTFNYTYNPSIPVYQVNATVDYQTITLEWSTFLSLNKTLLNDTIWFGDDLIYNITLVNYGPHDSYIVTVSDLLPEGLTINSVGVLYGSTSIIGDDVYWSISINAGSILSLIVNTTPAHEGVFVNNVTVNSTSQYDYILWGNMSVSGEVLPLFDLSINFTISNPPYYVGEEMNYTITIHNSGPSNASNVSVYIPIPSGLTFLYAWNLDGYIPNYTSSTGLWNVGTLCANETIQINMTLRLSGANWYNQTVNITGDGVEINETDNNKTISFNVTTQVDLELNMTISTNETLYGNLISVTYSLMNKGPSPATNVTMFTVFSGLTYYTAYGYGSFSNITPFTGYWYVGNLNNGSRVTLTLYFYANNVGTFTVTGRANCSDNESYWPDNYDNVTLNVIRYADLSITKTVSDSVAYVGQIINYTISVKNKGVFATENVTVYDVLDSRLIYNNSNPDYNGTHWFIGNLSIGEVRNLTFNVIVNGTGYIWNNASVNSSLND